MDWSEWALVSWATGASFVVLVLAVAVCSQRRRARGQRETHDGEPPSSIRFEGNRIAVPEPDLEPGGEPSGSDDGDATPLPETTLPLQLRRQPPPGSGAERCPEEPAGVRALSRLISQGAETEAYALPRDVIAAYRAYERLQRTELPVLPVLDGDLAVGRLLAAARAGDGIDPMGLCREIHAARTDRALHQEALQVLHRAVREAADVAVREAGGAADRVIAEALRPAYVEVLRRARDVAARLRPYTSDDYALDTLRIVTASTKVRNAYLEVQGLVRRHRALLEARAQLNAMGERTPRLDRHGLFAVFRSPLAFAPNWQPPAPVPLPPLPEDDTARLLWLASERAAVGEPWLPTVSEQDAAWWDQFGPEGEARPQFAAQGLAPRAAR